MDLKDAIKLIKHDSIIHTGNAVWADLGAGAGLFTYALANILLPGGIIYAIDKKNTAWVQHPNPNNIVIKQQQINFITDELNLFHLNGMVMANSLHFAENKEELLVTLSKSLDEKGCFLIVEYNTDTPNPWVPYPVSYRSLKELFTSAGYTHIEKIDERPSAFGRSSIYSVVIYR